MEATGDRVRDTAESIRQLIENSTDTHTPSIRALARYFHVDIKVALAALHLLAREGLVKITPRTRSTVVGRTRTSDRPMPLPKESSSRWLYRMFREQIESGGLRPGQYLPKQSYLCLKHGFSSHTVRKAYDLLCAGEFAHKRGNVWVVGRQERDRAVAATSIPVILLVQRKVTSWASLDNERTVRLMSSILAEVESGGVLLVPCCTSEPATGDRLPLAGMHEIAAYTHELGSRYIGAILVGFPKGPGPADTYRTALSSLGKPAVFLDIDSGDPSDSAKKPSSPHAHNSERLALRTAMNFLARMGHGTVGYIGADDGDWEERRGMLLAEICESTHPRIRMLRFRRAAAETIRSDPEPLREFLTRCSQSQSGKVRKTAAFLRSCVEPQSGGDSEWDLLTRQLQRWPRSHVRNEGGGAEADALRSGAVEGINHRLFHNMEVLLPFLLHDRVTCLVLPHDSSSSVIYTTLTGIGLSIPEDISLISFDNYMRHAVLPVTTVDFGFDSLGYRVIHHLLRDLPHISGARDEIVGQPKVVRRGSVGRLF